MKNMCCGLRKGWETPTHTVSNYRVCGQGENKGGRCLASAIPGHLLGAPL